MKSFAKVVIIFDSAILKIIIIIVNLFIIEIIEFIFHTLSLSQNALSIEEWLFVIKEIQIYAENLQFPKNMNSQSTQY